MRPSSRRPAPVELVAFGLSFLVFALFAAPGVAWMDPGELASAAFHLSGAHPPGHPAYVLMGKLATLVPVGEVAHRLALLSVLSQAAAIAGAVACARRLVPNVSELALVAAAALSAASPLLLVNATRAEVYGPSTALILWALAQLLTFHRTPEDPRPLYCTALLLGLAAAIHPLMAVAAALPMAVIGWRDARGRRGRVVPIAVALAVAPAVFYAGLWIAAIGDTPPLFLWGAPSTAHNWFNLVSAPAYQGNFSLAELPAQLARLLVFAGDGSGTALVFGGLVGLGFGALTGLPGAALVLAVVGCTLVGASTQQVLNPDMPGYLTPALLGLATGLASLVGAIHRLLPTDWQTDLRRHAAAIVVVPLVGLALASPAATIGYPRYDDGPLEHFDQTVDRMAPGPGLYVADGDHSLFAAHYERHVAGARPDLVVVTAEMTRDLWFLRYVKAAQPPLYVPYVDDGVRGALAERLVVSNLRSNRPVSGDLPAFGRLDPSLAMPVGRGFSYALTADAVPGKTAVLAPANYVGRVGEAVARRTGLILGLFEEGRERLVNAARATGLDNRLHGAHLAAFASAVITREHPSLYGLIPKSTPTFRSAPWQVELFALDLIWVAQAPALPFKVNEAIPEIAAHRALCKLLAGTTLPSDENLALQWSEALVLAGAEALRRADQGNLAEQLLGTRARVRPSAQVLLMLGSLAGARGDHAAAAEHFAKAVDLDPLLPDAWALLGRARLATGDLPGARAALAALQSVAPHSPELAPLARLVERAAGGGETTPGSLP